MGVLFNTGWNVFFTMTRPNGFLWRLIRLSVCLLSSHGCVFHRKKYRALCGRTPNKKMKYAHKKRELDLKTAVQFVRPFILGFSIRRRV